MQYCPHTFNRKSHKRSEEEGIVSTTRQPLIIIVSRVSPRGRDSWSAERYFATTRACRCHPICSCSNRVWGYSDVHRDKKKTRKPGKTELQLRKTGCKYRLRTKQHRRYFIYSVSLLR